MESTPRIPVETTSDGDRCVSDSSTVQRLPENVTDTEGGCDRETQPTEQVEGKEEAMDLPSSSNSEIAAEEAHANASSAAGEGEESERGWDVSRGARPTGMVGMASWVFPAAVHVVTGALGSVVAGAGYSVGKLGEFLGGGKAVDSPIFQSSFYLWLWSNGIFPEVQYEPWTDATRRKFASVYGSTSAKEDNVHCTPLLVCNHTSYLDGIVLAAACEGPRILAMASTKEIPVINKLMEELDVVFVDRSSEESRQTATEAINSHCASWLVGQKPMLIFPEGTTTNGESLINFRQGAFRPGLPVRPMLITYTGQWDAACTTYVETEEGQTKLSDEQWALQFFGHMFHSLHIRVLPPYVPDEAEKSDPALFAENCHSYMATELKRVREELRSKSWKAAAGREDGGLGYKPLDELRILSKAVTTRPGGCMGPRKPYAACMQSRKSDAELPASSEGSASTDGPSSSTGFASLWGGTFGFGQPERS